MVDASDAATSTVDAEASLRTFLFDVCIINGNELITIISQGYNYS